MKFTIFAFTQEKSSSIKFTPGNLFGLVDYNYTEM